MRALGAAAAAAIWLGGCSHTSPEEMGAAEHRQEAARHQAAASEAEAKYDPNAVIIGVTRGPWGSPNERLETYNPTVDYLRAAEAHSRAAAEHAQAAKQLEKWEGEACAGIAPSARAACPLLTPWVARVEETSRGIRLVLKPDADGAPLAQRMRCHLAFARAAGFTHPSCPLYFAGVSVLNEPRDVIELRGSTPGVAARIRLEARTLFRGSAHLAATH